jgi:hypothetical protein
MRMVKPTVSSIPREIDQAMLNPELRDPGAGKLPKVGDAKLDARYFMMHESRPK